MSLCGLIGLGGGVLCGFDLDPHPPHHDFLIRPFGAKTATGRGVIARKNAVRVDVPIGEMTMAGRKVLAAFLFVAVIYPPSAFPDRGGLDTYGCHHDRTRGGYHCHRGQFAGQHFSSKQEMLRKGAPGKTTDPSSPRPSAQRAEKRLRTLKYLLDNGLLTPEEYEKKRGEILKGQ